MERSFLYRQHLFLFKCKNLKYRIKKYKFQKRKIVLKPQKRIGALIETHKIRTEVMFHMDYISRGE